jgi:rSAM-associated Gly-rich repeat protein
MISRSGTIKALSTLLPAGLFGMSVALAAAPPAAKSAGPSESVDARLQAIRSGVSALTQEPSAEPRTDPNIIKVWWGNGGWGRPGWGNGGWRPGWRNGGWGNGGWRNGGWRNGGWPNFWRNW